MKDKREKLYRNNKGQLLILAGIIISILIVISATITVNLSYTNKPIDETIDIKLDYENLKEKFGEALDDRLTSQNLMDSVKTKSVFYNITKEFRLAMARHNAYFNASFIKVTYVSGIPKGLWASLTVKNTISSVTTEVYYYIE